MADAPPWGFADLPLVTRWILGYDLPTKQKAPAEVLPDDDWDRVRITCREHRLEGLLIAAVANEELPVTDAQRREVAEIELGLTRNRIHYDEICRPVIECLETEGVSYRLIKGSALPWSDYTDPQHRPTGDLDLLVPGSQLGKSVAALERIGGVPLNPEPVEGYARTVFKGLTVTMPTRLEVDLHRVLCWGPFGVRVPEADLWSPGRVFDRLGTPAVTFDVERTLIHVCAHLLILGAIRASEVRDVAQILFAPDLDPHKAIAIARRWGHEAILAVGIAMAERELVFDDHPLHKWASSYRVSRLDQLWLRVDQPDAPVHGVEPFAVFAELPDVRSRARFVKAVIAPKPGTDPSLGSRVRSTVQRIFQS